jgi:hypothetical protein
MAGVMSQTAAEPSWAEKIQTKINANAKNTKKYFVFFAKKFFGCIKNK